MSLLALFLMDITLAGKKYEEFEVWELGKIL